MCAFFFYKDVEFLINYYVKTNQRKKKREGGRRWQHESHPPKVWHSTPAPTQHPQNGAPDAHHSDAKNPG